MKLAQTLQKLKTCGPFQLFLFIVLIGLIPAIEDYSLFAIFGFSITHFHIHEEFFLLYAITLYTIPVGFVLLLGGKNYYRILGLLPVFFAAYIQLMGKSLSVSIQGYEALIGILHFLCYKIAFLYFIVKGKMRSLPFLIMLVVIWILLDLQHLVLFWTYSALFRLLYYAIAQNLNIFKETGLKKSGFLVFKSFLFWSPLLLFIIPGAILSSKLHKASIDNIYENTFIVSTNPERKYKRDQFESDLEFSLEAEIICINEALQENNQELSDIIKTKTDQMPDQVAAVYADILKPTLPQMARIFKEEDCGIFGPLNLPCQFKNGVRRGMNASYRDKRNDGLRSLVGAVRTSSNETQEEVEASTVAINEKLEANVVEFTNTIKFLIQSIFDTIIFVNLLLDIAFGFLILKSFMYVFSRVAFSSDTKNYITLLASDNTQSRGHLQKSKNQYTIQAKKEREVYYISRTFEPSGRAPRFSLPQWRAAILARIFSANYAMNKVIMEPDSEQVHFKAMGSNEFVEWDIQEGEEVIFNFKNFVGMSSGIRISAVISLRLTSLLFGRMIFTTAKGTGKLILLTKGEPITAADPKADASIATSRILAWQRNTRFNVESELNLVDVFMSGIYLKKKEGDLILIDADFKGKAKNGIVRFIKSFLLPI